MKTTDSKNWYDVIDLQRTVDEIKRRIVETKNFVFPKEIRYVHVVVDLETGNFAIRDGERNNIKPELLYALFPALADAPVAPVPPVDVPPVTG